MPAALHDLLGEAMSERTKILIEETLSKPSRVDADKGILYDCLLLGAESRNGVRYPDQTRQDAIPLLEGAKINLSHPSKRDKQALIEPVTWDRRYGKAFEVHNAPDGLRGNVKVLRKHPFTQTLLEAAEEMPEMFGFSPVMVGVCTPPDAHGVETCVKIKKVRSIDIVTDPGTTKSLFEELDMEKELREEEEVAKEEKEEERHEEEAEATSGPTHEAALMHVILDEIEEFLDQKADGTEHAKRIGQHLKHHAKMHHGAKEEEEPKEEAKEESKEESKEEKHAEEKEHEEEDRRWSYQSGRVLTEDSKPKVGTKKAKSGYQPAALQSNGSDDAWLKILRR